MGRVDALLPSGRSEESIEDGRLGPFPTAGVGRGVGLD